ncbi:MAG: hypothetical protein GY775_09760, partial [Candidatus Scalindua sp.]|nr:hypothetical protein [Candidatus Scalindua sp.]
PGFIREGSLVLIPSKCGYALSGSYKGTGNEVQVEIVTILRVGTDPIQTLIKEEEYIPCTIDLARLWDLDHIGISPNEVKAENKETMRSFDDTINFDQEKGQYIVSLPWKANKHLLPNNFGVALGRMRGLQRKFIGDHGLGEHYQHIIEEQKERGFIEQVESRLDDCHYLPHHGVSKDSLTTPIRVVFDCSAKKSDKSLSLNDCLHTGPTLVPDLAKVLLRFRCNTASEVTKRQCLSIIAQLFDPLGVLLPVTIKSRMFLQNLWRCKVEWDQLIPQDLVETWQSLLTDLQACCTIEYPRRVADNRVVELHAFSDASNSAYGAAVYFCCEGISRLVMAKAKVAPIKPVTIPKLELTALLLAARLTTFITDAYQGILEIAKV